MSTNSTIMIAEDDRGFRELLVLALEGHGFGVLSAENSGQALALLKTGVPDLLLLDLRLGQESGIDLLKKTRQLPGGCELPVILLTGYSDRDSVLEVARLGVQGYILKHQLSHTDLLKRIREQFENKATLIENCKASIPPLATLGSEPRTTSETPVDAELPAQSDSPVSLKPISTSAHVLEQIDKGTAIKALSPTVMQLMDMTDRSDCSLEQIARVVKRDPAIALKILQIANSVVYNRGGSVDTVQKALSRIGLAQIRQLVLNISVIERFHLKGLGEHFDSRLFWEHSIATGLIAAAITRFRAGNEREIDNAFTCGLLHDVARMVLAEQLGEMYLRVLDAASREHLPLEQAESRMLLANHADLMERVLYAWSFPKNLVEPIAMHHMSVVNIRAMAPQAIETICTLSLANRLAHAMLLGSSGNDCIYPTDEFVRILELKHDAIRFIEDQIPEQSHEMKYVMLQSGKDTAWPDYAELSRKKFKRPIRALYLSATTKIDAYRILFERLHDRKSGRKPNVAVLYSTEASAQTALSEKLVEEEKNSGMNPLPVLLITALSSSNTKSRLLAGRMHKVLPSPFTLSQLAKTLDQLLPPE